MKRGQNQKLLKATSNLFFTLKLFILLIIEKYIHGYLIYTYCVNNSLENSQIILDTPEKSRKPTNIDSNTKQFIPLKVSDLGKDEGQSVIPFFDAQTAEAIPTAPLSGIYLYIPILVFIIVVMMILVVLLHLMPRLLIMANIWRKHINHFMKLNAKDKEKLLELKMVVQQLMMIITIIMRMMNIEIMQMMMKKVTMIFKYIIQ